MAPRVIADSDDDDDDSNYDSPPSRPPAPGRSGRESRHPHEPVDRSGSTDSAFFRSVLDEQSAAARNCARILRDVDAKPAPENYSAPTTMSTDPLQDSGELPGQFSTGGSNDPWEVPSSPENKHSSSRAKRKAGNRRMGTSSSVQEEDSSRSNKRRKIESLPGHTQDSDGIDLVQFPPTRQPAQLIGNNLTNSQKEAYQSFAATGTTQISQDQGPAQRENATPIARSSSSATNVNTPRSDLKASKNMDTILEQEQQTPEKTDAWNSSPDEISAPQPTSAVTTRTRRKRDKRRRSPMSPSEGEAAEPAFDTEFDKVDRAIYEANADDSDYEEMSVKVQKPKKLKGRSKKTTNTTPADKDETSDRESDTRCDKADLLIHEIKDGEADQEEPDVVFQKPKKQRGRPKKTPDPGSTTDPANPPTSHAAEGRSVTKPKKKRGRPRKAEQQAVKGTTKEVADDARVDAEDQAVATENHDAPTADSVPTESDLQTQEKAASASVDLPKEELSPIASDPKSSGAETGNRYEEPDPANYSTSATKMRPATIPSSGSKPIYRVGLSKRSRIAPLLKIRK